MPLQGVLTIHSIRHWGNVPYMLRLRSYRYLGSKFPDDPITRDHRFPISVVSEIGDLFQVFDLQFPLLAISAILAITNVPSRTGAIALPSLSTLELAQVRDLLRCFHGSTFSQMQH